MTMVPQGVLEVGSISEVPDSVPEIIGLCMSLTPESEYVSLASLTRWTYLEPWCLYGTGNLPMS